MDIRITDRYLLGKNGKIIRNYLDGTNVKREEYMYIHLFSRPISFKAKTYSKDIIYAIYPDVVKEIEKG